MGLRRFKLIKEYPGSPKLGKVIGITEGTKMYLCEGLKIPYPNKYPEFWEEIQEVYVPIGTKFTYAGNPSLTAYYSLDAVNGSSLIISSYNKEGMKTSINDDFPISTFNDCFEGGIYKEYKEKDYEILSISTNSYIGITRSAIDLEAYLQGHKSTLDWSIHSVKRLSDGEVFTIGDRIKCETEGIITEFLVEDLSKSGLTVYCDRDTVLGGYNNCCLSYINKYKEPVFITEDGVDVFIRDTYWYIDEEYEIFLTKEAVDTSGKIDSFKYFSTEKAAKNYIKCHKPVLSYNDVLTLFRDWNNGPPMCSSFEVDLTDLINKKI